MAQDVKQLISEYVSEIEAYKARLDQLQTALVLITTQYGKPNKKGELVLRIPAGIRSKAKAIESIKYNYGNPQYRTHGALTLTARKAK